MGIHIFGMAQPELLDKNKHEGGKKKKYHVNTCE